MQRSDLLSAAQAVEWKKQFNGWRFLPSEIERMFGEKLYDSGGYKGQGIDCQFLVPLLPYYVELVADHVGELTPKLVSFRALARCCRELWKLRFRYQPIVDYEPVLELANRQSEHQTTCLAAYEITFIRPKHHHRLHIPQACVVLGALPSCAAMEKKRRCLKGGGLFDKTESLVNQSARWQKAVNPKMLELSWSNTESFHHASLSAAIKPASAGDQAAFTDTTPGKAQNVIWSQGDCARQTRCFGKVSQLARLRTLWKVTLPLYTWNSK